jgi:hypothetical protein
MVIQIVISLDRISLQAKAKESREAEDEKEVLQQESRLIGTRSKTKINHTGS